MSKMKLDAVGNIFDLKQFGEFGDVNPSITDSSTYTFLAAQTMSETFEGETEGCFLYSRHWNPSNKYLSDALAAMEGTEAGWVTASGMSAITTSILQLCQAGDHIITSVTTYGGTFAFLQNYLPKFNINVTFVNIANLDGIEKAIRPNTRLIYTESLTNPLLQVSDIPRLADLAQKHGIKLIVDNTFAPLIISPSRLGADITVYSMTKFINGKNDCVAGAICSSAGFIEDISNVNDGTAMLLGPVLDPLRSSSILKNLHTLHIRMKKHSENAMYLAQRMQDMGLKVVYPGLSSHPGHSLMKTFMHPDFGFGGMMAIDLGKAEMANRLMERMQHEGVGYLAVSLGYFKTLFSNSGKSTSSEVPKEIQRQMGLSEGLIRFSVGLDHDIEKTWNRMAKCIRDISF
jgi:methionine-gamma-lyase